jgi:hypothetical protein
MNTEADISLRLPPPPRVVPLSLRIATLFGVFMQIGCVLLVFPGPLAFLLASECDLSPLTFRGEIVMTNGTVTGVQETTASEGRVRVRQVRYAYSVEGQRIAGVSWVTGVAPEPGAVVIVEYQKRDPVRSRIQGMRRGLFGPAPLLVLVFPLVGIAVAGASLRTGAKEVRLLEKGAAALATLVASEPTATRVNRERVWEHTFRLTAPDGSIHQVKTCGPRIVETATEVKRLLFYDSDDPQSALSFESFSPAPLLDEAAAFRGVPGPAIRRAILPGLVVFGYSCWVLQLLG